MILGRKVQSYLSSTWRHVPERSTWQMSPRTIIGNTLFKLTARVSPTANENYTYGNV